MSMIEDFYAQKDMKQQINKPVDPAQKYLKQETQVEAEEPQTNEHN